MTEEASLFESVASATYNTVVAPFAAAFRTDNTVGALLSAETIGADNTPDPDFNFGKFIADNNLFDVEEKFYDAKNERYARLVLEQIQRERQDRETLEASGAVGFVAQVAAGVIDLPSLIPGGTLVRGLRGGYSIIRSGASVAAAAGVSTAAQELALQQLQFTRPIEESLTNVGAGVVLGGLLGGVAAGVMTRAERAAAAKALDEVIDIESGAVPDRPNFDAVSLSAASSPSGNLFDRVDDTLEGAAARVVDRAATLWSPAARGAQRLSSIARETMAKLSEDTRYRKFGSEEGPVEVLPQAVETNIRARMGAINGEFVRTFEEQFARRAKDANVTKLTSAEFSVAVARGARKLEEDIDDPYVLAVVKVIRKRFDELAKEAVELGIIKEKDLEVRTADAYFTRVVDANRLRVDKAGWDREVADDWMLGLMRQAYLRDIERIRKAERSLDETAALLTEDPALRAQRYADVQGRLIALDQDPNNDFARAVQSGIRSLQRQRRAAINAGNTAEADRLKAEIESRKAFGGDDLKSYTAARSRARAELQAIRVADPDRAAAKRADLEDKIIGTIEDTRDSVQAFALRAANLLKTMDSRADRLARADALDVELEKLQRLLAENKELLDRIARGEVKTKATVTKVQAWIEKNSEKAAKLAERAKTAREGAIDITGEAALLFDDVVKQVAGLSLRRGQYIEKALDRIKKADPETAKENRKRALDKRQAKIDSIVKKFNAKWNQTGENGGDVSKLNGEELEAFLRSTAKQASDDVYYAYTGLDHSVSNPVLNELHVYRAGPFRNRTFGFPDERMSRAGWLNEDVTQVFPVAVRRMLGDIEVRRMFKDETFTGTEGFSKTTYRHEEAVYRKMAAQYLELQTKVDAAKSVDQINALFPRKIVADKTPLAKAKLIAKDKFGVDQKGAENDLKAMVELVRGVYASKAHATTGASVLRSLVHYNYLRLMGGVTIGSLSEIYRPAMVHGLRNFVSIGPEAFSAMRKAAFSNISIADAQGGKLTRPVERVLEELRAGGVAIERVTNSLLLSSGDMADVILSPSARSTPERLVRATERGLMKTTNLASKYLNLQSSFTDATQAVAGMMSINRMVDALKAGDDLRWRRMLRVSDADARALKKLLDAHAVKEDGLWLPNTEKWNDPRLTQVFRNAIYTDVSSIIVRRGYGDAPFFVNTPLGAVLFQFLGYTLAAHQKVLLRGLQEEPRRMLHGVIGMTLLGMLSSYLVAAAGGQTRLERYEKEIMSNPGAWIAEGLDRSGIFSVMFDLSNRVERLSGAGSGWQGGVNPIKAPLQMLGGDRPLASGSGRIPSEGDGLTALLGPSAGLYSAGMATFNIADRALRGAPPAPKSVVRDAVSGLPLAPTYIGARDLVKLLNDDHQFLGR